MKQVLLGVGSGLFAGLAVLGILFTGPLSAPDEQPVAQEVVEATLEPQPTQEPEPLETETAEPEPQVVECSVKDYEDAEDILILQAQVLDAQTGDVLFDRGSETPARAASVMKLFTAAAALETLGPDYRVTTRVYVDSEDPTVLYLVGAGDVTLSRTGINETSVYRNAPKLSTLASQVSKALGNQTFSQIVLDSTAYGSPKGEYRSVWDQRGLTTGYMSYVSALQVDGDRNNPRSKDSPRSNDPVQRAGNWFKEALGDSAKTARVLTGSAPASAIEVAKVQSAPMSTWIDYMLIVSDNTLAEAIARLVSLDVGLNGSFDSLTDAYKRALKNTGLDLNGLQVEDGSGLSRYNQVSPNQVNSLLKLIDQGYGDFELITKGMPVSGTPGSLSNRLLDAVGAVTAKTGWIRTGYSLAGFLDTPDDSRLIFTVYNLGDVTVANREAMDELVMAFYNCGKNLVNR
jgi:D-alanyl-D-alanine carboxypeptidase/D-alanyl-D-alanine-endopeptidase (penicillin-binding protein 4)